MYRFDVFATNVPSSVHSLELEWDWGDSSEKVTDRRDPAPSGPPSFQYSHAYGREQAYTLTVRLFDTSRGYRALLASLPVKLTIGEELSLRIDPTTTVAEPNDDVTFKALASKAPAGAQFEWTFDDGSGKVYTRTPEVTHRFPREGAYTVQVVLVDTGRPRSEGELAAAKAQAVIRKSGPVAIVHMIVDLHTGHLTGMRRKAGSELTSVGFNNENRWDFPRVEAQGLSFWGQGSETKDGVTRTWRIKGQLTADRRAVELLDMEYVSEAATGDGRDYARDRLVLRNLPLVRQDANGMLCSVSGADTRQHVGAIESVSTRDSKYEKYRFELDPADIDWSALDRSYSLDHPLPASASVRIIPTK